jgi:hypothetical protein
MGPRGSNGANGNEKHIIFYMNQGYSGERCGPWTSCFYTFSLFRMFIMLFVFKNPLLHVRNRQLPGASPLGPPLGVSRQPPAFYCAPIPIRNSWIRHCKYIIDVILSTSGCWNFWMLDLDSNLDMTRLAMGFHCMVDASLSRNSWEKSYIEAACTMWSLTDDHV